MLPDPNGDPVVPVARTKPPPCPESWPAAEASGAPPTVRLVNVVSSEPVVNAVLKINVPPPVFVSEKVPEVRIFPAAAVVPEAANVALELIVKVPALGATEMVAPAGMPYPTTGIPTARFAVFDVTTTALPAKSVAPAMEKGAVCCRTNVVPEATSIPLLAVSANV